MLTLSTIIRLHVGMYRSFQFFVLALKIDIFTGFLVSIFYLIQFALKQGITWESGIQLVVTILMLPMLYFARTAVSNCQGRRVISILIPYLAIGERREYGSHDCFHHLSMCGDCPLWSHPEANL